MGYPALWPTLINEVGPKRRKSKARKIVVKLWRVFENMIVSSVTKDVATNVVVVHGDFGYSNPHTRSFCLKRRYILVLKNFRHILCACYPVLHSIKQFKKK